MDLINKIVEIMDKKNITAYKLEKDIGIKQATFSNWKQGKEPGAEKILKLIKYLEVTPNELFGYEETIELSENDKEMLKLFQKLPEREQIKMIARIEDKVNEVQPKGQSSDLRTG